MVLPLEPRVVTHPKCDGTYNMKRRKLVSKVAAGRDIRQLSILHCGDDSLPLVFNSENVTEQRNSTSSKRITFMLLNQLRAPSRLEKSTS